MKYKYENKTAPNVAALGAVEDEKDFAVSSHLYFIRNGEKKK